MLHFICNVLTELGQIYTQKKEKKSLNASTTNALQAGL